MAIKYNGKISYGRTANKTSYVQALSGLRTNTLGWWFTMLISGVTGGTCSTEIKTTYLSCQQFGGLSIYIYYQNFTLLPVSRTYKFCVRFDSKFFQSYSIHFNSIFIQQSLNECIFDVSGPQNGFLHDCVLNVVIGTILSYNT